MLFTANCPTPKSENGRGRSMELRVEVEGEDGSKFAFKLGDDDEAKTLFGRGCGFNTNDRTVSRRHVSFQLNSEPEPEPRVSFEVIGKNPFWVWTNNDRALTLFRKFEKGHLQFGDRFCLSGKVPIWFNLKKTELQEGAENEEMDVSGFDPVKEFGFLVMGQEFDNYPKGMIRNVKDWEWFLEEPRKDSEDEEDFGKERREMRRKRKKGKDNNEDDEWTGESEDDKNFVAKIRKGKMPRYSTRAKDSEGPNRGAKGSGNSKQKKATGVNGTVEEEEDDDDDETLGGFIVEDEDDKEEEENSEEEEDEFEEEDDDDD